MSPASPGSATGSKAQFEQREGVKLSFLPFFAKAAIDALKVYPQVNASIDTEAGRSHTTTARTSPSPSTPSGVARTGDQGAGDLSIAGISRKIADIAARTRDNKITPDELSGGTFTLTNTGSRGALFDTPIINQPQVAILGTGTVVKRPVVIDDANLGETIAVRHMVYLALTYDHRLVDGADAARFLVAVKQRLEEAASRPNSGCEVRFVLGGASGYLGTALRDHLARGGHDVVRLVRGEAPDSPSESGPSGRVSGAASGAVLASADVVVNLSGATTGRFPGRAPTGAPILDGPHQEHIHPRRSDCRPRPQARVLSEHRDELLRRRSRRRGAHRGLSGRGWVSGRSRDPWEGSTRVAAESGARVCLMRSGVVLGPGGGLARVVADPIQARVGGRLGDDTRGTPGSLIARSGPRRGLPRRRLTRPPARQPDGAAAPGPTPSSPRSWAPKNFTGRRCCRCRS